MFSLYKRGVSLYYAGKSFVLATLFLLKYTKANIYLSCDVRSSSNAKCARPITLNSY